MAALEQIRPKGTLGILLSALGRELLTAQDVRQTIEALIREHRFRIGIEVYEAVLAQINGARGSSG